VCVGIETAEAFIGVTAGIELVAAGPVAAVGKITSWKNMNRVGIENVPAPPPDEPPEFMVKVTVDVVPPPDVLPVVVPIVLVGIETCIAGAGAIGVGIIGAGAIVPMPGHSNSRPSSDSTEIEGFRRARRAFIACWFCSCWDLMGLFLCKLSQSRGKPHSIRVRNEPLGYESIQTGLDSPKHSARIVSESLHFFSIVMQCGRNMPWSDGDVRPATPKGGTRSTVRQGDVDTPNGREVGAWVNLAIERTTPKGRQMNRSFRLLFLELGMSLFSHSFHNFVGRIDNDRLDIFG
jgi:hypothetical protein